MAHTHSHGHGLGSHEHKHHHAVTETADARKRVAFAAALTFAFMIAEVIGGVVSGSLALLADAAHMLTDAGSLALAWLGFKLAERPADSARSFGWARFKILAAFVNGILLLLLAAWIIFEAIQRLLDPAPVMGEILMGVAVAGLLVNIIASFLLHGGDQEDLNLQGALWHVAGDLLGSVAAIAAAFVIMFTGWMPIDPLLSMLVAGLIIFAGVRITLQSAHILIEGVPSGLSPGDIKADLEATMTFIREDISGEPAAEGITIIIDSKAGTIEGYANPDAEATTVQLDDTHDVGETVRELIKQLTSEQAP